MNYVDCIKLSMCIIENVLLKGYVLQSSYNLNSIDIALTENGILLREEKYFDCDYTFGARELKISPSYFLSKLFEPNDYEYDEHKLCSISLLTKFVDDNQFENSISYIELVNQINKIRTLESTGYDDKNVTSYDYINEKT